MRVKLLLLIFVVLFSTLLTGCSAADEEMLNAFILDYIVSNMDKIAARKIFGGSGDDWVDASLDIKEVMDELNKADKLMEQGLRDNDPAKMDEAISLRPDDWSYRTQRAAYALENGDVNTFQEHFDHANGLFEDDDTGQLSYLNDAIEQFEDLENRTDLSLDGSQADCSTLYTTLSQLYADRAEITGSDDDQGRASGYENQANYCQ